MGLFDFIGPASGLLFTLENIIWINLGVFIGCVFAAIPGLSVILCIILFLPVTYTMRAVSYTHLPLWRRSGPARPTSPTFSVPMPGRGSANSIRCSPTSASRVSGTT